MEESVCRGRIEEGDSPSSSAVEGCCERNWSTNQVLPWMKYLDNEINFDRRRNIFKYFELLIQLFFTFVCVIG